MPTTAPPTAPTELVEQLTSLLRTPGFDQRAWLDSTISQANGQADTICDTLQAEITAAAHWKEFVLWSGQDICQLTKHQRAGRFLRWLVDEQQLDTGQALRALRRAGSFYARPNIPTCVREALRTDTLKLTFVGVLRSTITN